jgi:thioredoxin-related protein
MRMSDTGAYHGPFSRTSWLERLQATLFAASILISATAVGNPGLHALAVQSDSTALEAALAAGANPEQRSDKGEPPLMSAVKAERTDAVKALLAAGADPDNTNRMGESSLHLAVRGDSDILKSLISAGANTNARDAGGVTPLMLAAAAGGLDNIDLLRAAGARLDMKDYQGSSVKDWALRGGHSELAEKLESALSGAQTSTATQTSTLDFAEDVFVDVKFPDWFKTSFLDLRDDLEEALDAGKQGIMLFISTSRCSYCKAFMDTSLADPAIRERLTDSFDVIGLEIFDDSELTTLDGRQYRVKEFVTRNRASYTPTLIFFGEYGQPLLRIVGYYPPDRFRQVLDYLDARAYERQPLREYLQASSREPAAGGASIISDDLFEQPPYMLDRSRMSSDRPLLVVFEGSGCAACDRFHRRVLQDKSIRRLIGEYEAVQLDARDEEGRVMTPAGEKRSPSEWYRELGLNYLPAILFFDEGGKEVMRLDSETLRFRMEGSLQLVLERAYEQDAQLQRWRRTKAIESIQRRSAGL